MRESVFSIGKEARGSKSPSSVILLFVSMRESKLGMYCSKFSPILLEIILFRFNKRLNSVNLYVPRN